ncbi:MAG: hypothetical protein ACR2NA_14055 [Solirubrobacterales bacterium]
MIRRAAKAMPVGRLMLLAQAAVQAKRHYDLLTPVERKRLLALIGDSKAMPWRMSSEDRSELFRLVQKMEPARFGQSVVGAGGAIPGRGRRIR